MKKLLVLPLMCMLFTLMAQDGKGDALLIEAYGVADVSGMNKEVKAFKLFKADNLYEVYNKEDFKPSSTTIDFLYKRVVKQGKEQIIKISIEDFLEAYDSEFFNALLYFIPNGSSIVNLGSSNRVLVCNNNEVLKAQFNKQK